MKLYYQHSMGTAKYCISYHNGTDTHKDGSPFYGIRCFHNKRKCAKFERELLRDGYSCRY